MQPPRSDETLPHLADVAPAVLAAMGVPGFADTLALPGDIAGAGVLLIDGLGAELLDRHLDDAPVLAGLRGRRLQVGFPATTVAGLAAIGTGCRSGEHGMVGLSFRLPGAGVFNALRWQPETMDPQAVQPLPTTFQRATAAGVEVSVVSAAQFAGSGVTRAVLRGGRYVGVLGMGDLAAAVSATVAAGGFCYGYHGDLDLLGHLHGPGSPAWRMQLRQVDRLVASVIEELPAGGLLAVVADHGMIAADPQQTIDLDAEPTLLDGVADLGGEARARHAYVRPGALDDVLAGWRAVLGDRAWVVHREEAVELGWFGPRVRDAVFARIGDVVAAARDRAVLVRRTAEPMESALVGHHGSLTAAEQQVPLLLAYG